MRPIAAQTSRNLFFLYETSGMIGVGNHAPFWHTSNRQGIPSIEKENGYMHFSAFGNAFWGRDYSVDFGMDFGFGGGLQEDIFVHQLYVDLDFKWLGVFVGMKERSSDKNRNLSSGALTWSGNSKPIPEVRVGIPDYVRMPILGGWISLKGHIGYGRLTDDNWRRLHGAGTFVEDVLFHSKSAFIRFGDVERLPLQVTLGLEMNSMFGGTRHSGEIVTKKPSDAKTYLTVLFPFHPVGQQGNDDGNNLGSWHLNFDYSSNGWHVGAYYEHFYEDHSSMLGVEYKSNNQDKKSFISYGFRHNWFDGLYGVEVNAPKEMRIIRNAVIEFMNTRGQSGPVCNFGPLTEGVDGRDDMYNHTFYNSYSHWGFAMGNPIFVSPVYNDEGLDNFQSNRVRMFHVGFDGGITDNIDYRVLATTTTHWGCYGSPLKDIEQVTSIMLECSYCLGDSYSWKFSLSGSMDIDSGCLLGNNKGVMLTISKAWNIL